MQETIARVPCLVLCAHSRPVARAAEIVDVEREVKVGGPFGGRNITKEGEANERVGIIATLTTISGNTWLVSKNGDWGLMQDYCDGKTGV